MSNITKIIIVAAFLFLSFYIGLILITRKAGEILTERYKGYDTSIVYKNGKWDTTITKRQTPNWLK